MQIIGDNVSHTTHLINTLSEYVNLFHLYHVGSLLHNRHVYENGVEFCCYKKKYDKITLLWLSFN